MHIRNIEKTEINGMILQHSQTLPEICYNGCVLCFIDFDGDIKGVHTRLAELNTKEYKAFKN